ncbi:MATH domain and coiled-coil domain-containing protein At2g42470-like [Brassica rapa]|uniref:MATH domain-containing protein n=2 Tax=Brassica TaxID=3705 RepID=M4ERS2_BRACM|nr:MATH domain and coiled-coil domain-containing protein At2g42470-like [Brassica rapa]XP_048591305.1 MATH domain and coiled-coil domain-containing protein At2g42470-like [Brassica napus]
MEDKKQTSFTFEIDNFSEKEAGRRSPQFLAGGCEWYIQVYSNGELVDDHLSMYLGVANPESLRLGWKRRASFSFLLLNQSGKELYRTKELCALFCDQLTTAWGRSKALPLKKLQEKGFLENKKLIVKVEVKVIEVVDEAEEVTRKKMLDVQGFKVLHSQAVLVSRLFEKHPDIAVNFKPKNQQVKTTYMIFLLHLIETLKKRPHSISETEIWIAGNELIVLTEAGFELDWLKTKLHNISFKRMLSYDNVSRVQEFENQVKNLKAEVSLERKTTTYDNCSRVQKLEKQVKNLTAELNIEKEKSATYATKVYALEKTVSDIIELSSTRSGTQSRSDLGDFKTSTIYVSGTHESRQ